MVTTTLSSKAVDGREVTRGVSQPLRCTEGASAYRMIETPDSEVEEHAHDWPVLSIYVLGACTRFFEDRVLEITGPCAVLHPKKEFHRSRTGSAGLEQIDIEFDPSWARLCPSDYATVRYWRGGKVGDAVRRLTAIWSAGRASREELRTATATFLEAAQVAQPIREPTWLSRTVERIGCDPNVRTADLARELSLNTAWINQAYRMATGEGLHQTILRKRVERACVLLRTSNEPTAQIAFETGFCDQSHMIRCFRKILGRTPERVRAEYLTTDLQRSRHL